MPKLASSIDANSSEFAENAAAMREQARALHERLDQIHRGGGEAACQKADRSALDVAFDPGDLAGEADVRHDL